MTTEQNNIPNTNDTPAANQADDLFPDQFIDNEEEGSEGQESTGSAVSKHIPLKCSLYAILRGFTYSVIG